MSFVSPGEVWAIFCTVKGFIEEVQAQGGEIETIKLQIGALHGVLLRVKNLSEEHGGATYSKIKSEQKDILQAHLKRIHADLRKAEAILYRWKNQLGPGGVEFTGLAKKLKAPQIVFALQQEVSKLKKIAEDLKVFEGYLEKWINWINFEQLASAKPVATSKPVPNKHYSILFVDKDNTGRSKVAQGYTKLLQGWTNGTNGMWKINQIDSAGLHVEYKNECIPQLNAMKTSVKRQAGRQRADPLAMSALFDNEFFKYSYKPRIRESLESIKSQGISNTIFRDYDYVICFTALTVKDLIELKEQLIKQFQSKAAPGGKGTIVFLGGFANMTDPNIYAPIMKVGDDDANKKKWIKTVSLIKVGVKNFLKFHLDWKQPNIGYRESM